MNFHLRQTLAGEIHARNSVILTGGEKVLSDHAANLGPLGGIRRRGKLGVQHDRLADGQLSKQLDKLGPKLGLPATSGLDNVSRSDDLSHGANLSVGGTGLPGDKRQLSRWRYPMQVETVKPEEKSRSRIPSVFQLGVKAAGHSHVKTGMQLFGHSDVKADSKFAAGVKSGGKPEVKLSVQLDGKIDI